MVVANAATTEIKDLDCHDHISAPIVKMSFAAHVFVMFSFHSFFRVNYDAACDLDSTKYHIAVTIGELDWSL